MSSEARARRRLRFHLQQAMAAAAGKPMPIDGCVVFQADVHRAAFGVDPIAAWRGRYRTERGMRRVMGKGGLLGCMQAVARQQRWRCIHPSNARVGDVGLAETPTGIGVVRKLHRNDWIGRNEAGWSVLPTKAVRVAWAVI